MFRNKILYANILYDFIGLLIMIKFQTSYLNVTTSLEPTLEVDDASISIDVWARRGIMSRSLLLF